MKINSYYTNPGCINAALNQVPIDGQSIQTEWFQCQITIIVQGIIYGEIIYFQHTSDYLWNVQNR